EPSNEVSGIAINARKQEGDVGSFEFVDNLGKAIRFTGEILVDMIPRVYDNERVVRIIGIDGAEDYVTINQEIEDEETGQMKKVNDLGTGKYDVAVTLGPSFTTQRQEALAGLVEVSGAVPIVAEVAADQVVKNLDVPGADEIEKRVKIAMIQRGIIQPGKDDEEIVAELQQSVGQQNQAINAELEQEKLQEQAKTEREIVAAEGDIAKENARAAADAAKRDAERNQRGLEMQLEREQMALEHDKIALERDRLKASTATDIQNERVSKETQKTNGANMETFAKSLTEAITGLSGAAEKMADASEAQADAAKVAAMPKVLVRDENGQAIGAKPVKTLQ
ncbi:MAG: hypothetical protein GY927_24770, partial [bacterium]|nr:hypothetical protein [bacterium]